MTIMVSKVQRSTLTFDKGSTVLDLIRALTENLEGEWDDARLVPRASTVDIDGVWRLDLVLSDGEEEPARHEKWATEDGKHVAEVTSYTDGDVPTRTCSCGVEGTDYQMATHLSMMAGSAWRPVG